MAPNINELRTGGINVFPNRERSPHRGLPEVQISDESLVSWNNQIEEYASTHPFIAKMVRLRAQTDPVTHLQTLLHIYDSLPRTEAYSREISKPVTISYLKEKFRTDRNILLRHSDLLNQAMEKLPQQPKPRVNVFKPKAATVHYGETRYFPGEFAGLMALEICGRGSLNQEISDFIHELFNVDKSELNLLESDLPTPFSLQAGLINSKSIYRNLKVEDVFAGLEVLFQRGLNRYLWFRRHHGYPRQDPVLIPPVVSALTDTQKGGDQTYPSVLRQVVSDRLEEVKETAIPQQVRLRKYPEAKKPKEVIVLFASDSDNAHAQLHRSRLAGSLHANLSTKYRKSFFDKMALIPQEAITHKPINRFLQDKKTKQYTYTIFIDDIKSEQDLVIRMLADWYTLNTEALDAVSVNKFLKKWQEALDMKKFPFTPDDFLTLYRNIVQKPSAKKESSRRKIKRSDFGIPKDADEVFKPEQDVFVSTPELPRNKTLFP